MNNIACNIASERGMQLLRTAEPKKIEQPIFILQQLMIAIREFMQGDIKLSRHSSMSFSELQAATEATASLLINIQILHIYLRFTGSLVDYKVFNELLQLQAAQEPSFNNGLRKLIERSLEKGDSDFISPQYFVVFKYICRLLGPFGFADNYLVEHMQSRHVHELHLLAQAGLVLAHDMRYLDSPLLRKQCKECVVSLLKQGLKPNGATIDMVATKNPEMLPLLLAGGVDIDRYYARVNGFISWLVEQKYHDGLDLSEAIGYCLDAGLHVRSQSLQLAKQYKLQIVPRLEEAFASQEAQGTQATTHSPE